jgi:superfamily II DNA helicase RecQ
LEVNDSEGVDARAAAEVRCRFFEGQQVTGDPLLKSVKRDFYRSVGQRAAVRTALSTPPGGTTVIALPTGEGKSLIFQLAHTVGFVGSKGTDGRSVTLVIVPTVALGVNHQIEAVSICGLAPPLAYQGGNDVSNAQIAKQVTDGTQGLCFASPEAACGALRGALRKAAEGGYLRAMVIDEAHLVDQWGTGFRTEFQELSGLRRELLAAAPPEQRMRTLLLSATLTSTVGIGPRSEGGFGLEIALAIALPGVERAAAEALVAKAHEVCPYSNATRNNIDVKLSVV